MLETRYQLFVFVRYPVPGKSKTRLIPALGPEGSARLSRRLAEHAVTAARTVQQSGTMPLIVCATGGRRRQFRAWLGSDLYIIDQPRGDIGERMHRIFKNAFTRSAPGALLIGSDLPDISSNLLRQACETLDNHDIVLGPAADGGYYLIGMKHFHPELFTRINWAKEHVAQQTRAAAARLGLSLGEAPTLNDIDRPEDLPAVQGDPRFCDIFSGRPRLSVIIPTLNEAPVLKATIDRAQQADNIEIIVSDGASQDATCAIAKNTGVEVITSAGGRAAQMNMGAAVAAGRHLLFLHADTLLPKNYNETVHRTLDDPATVAGAFRLRTDVPTLSMRMVEWGTNLRSSVLQWPYGDQGLFLEKRVFEEMGGFLELPIMEDFELVQRLRSRGRIITVPEAAATSARRWQKLGILRTIIRNQAMILGYYAGIKPERLARFYRTESGSSDNDCC